LLQAIWITSQQVISIINNGETLAYILQGALLLSLKLAAMALTKRIATGEEEFHGVLIVGGGICGLATALALHMYISINPFMQCV
jgi:hypothetical protein